MLRYSLILWLCYFSFPVLSFAQLSADELLKSKNYREALRKFQAEYSKNRMDPELNRKIGQCYLYSHIDKNKAWTYLDAAARSGKVDHEVWYELGLAYQYTYKLDDAEKAFNNYKEKVKGKDLEKVNRQLETCANARELIKKPIDVTFENLGKNVNSEFADYYPFIPADESFVVFTTRRRMPGAVVEFDGLFASDILISEVKNGEFQKAKSVGPIINTPEDEECVGLTHDGHSMLIYIDHTKAAGDLYISHKDPHKPFGATAPFSTTVNSVHLESSGSINMEEDVVVFASNRPGGYGGLDIYLSRRLPGDLWTEPINMGPSINTKYDEDFPQLSDDGHELYFCSKGHFSMGGYDVFVSRFKDESKSWSAPRNIGYPLNTTDDDMHYAVSASGHEAYISAWRPEGLGDLDIYRVILNKTEQRITALVGSVFLSDTLHPATENFYVLITDKKTGNPVNFGEIKYSAAKKKFVAALPPGHYTITLDVKGYEPLKADLDLLDKSDFHSMEFRKYILYKPGEKPPLPAPAPPKKAGVKQSP